MDNSENIVFVSDIPERFSLFKLKTIIGEELKDNDALLTIGWATSKDGTKLAKLHLRDQQCVEHLVDNKLILVEFKDEPHILVMTDTMPIVQTQTDHCDEVETIGDHEESDDNSDTASIRSEPPRHFQNNYSHTQDSNIQMQQNRLHCTKIPRDMLNRASLRAHFSRSGNITNIFIAQQFNKMPFAKISFETHEMASHAVQFGHFIKERNWNMIVDWDRVEAGQIRDRLTNQRRNNYSHELRPSMSMENIHSPPASKTQKQRQRNKSTDERNQARPTTPRKQNQRRHASYEADERNQARPTTPRKQNQRRHASYEGGDMEPSTSSGKRRPSKEQQPHTSREKPSTSSGIREESNSGDNRPGTSTRRKSNQPQDTGGKSPSPSKPIPTPRRNTKPNIDPIPDPGPVAGDPLTWFDLLEKDKGLFTGNQYRCVLLQTEANISLDVLKKHFKTRDLQPVPRKVYKMFDGTLVLFDTAKAAEECLKLGKTKIADSDAKFVKKKIPQVFDDQLLLEGLFDSIDVVQDLLDTCDLDDVKHDVTELGDSKYLIEFEDAVDVDKVIKSLEELDLEDLNPKASKVCHSDCLRVDDVSDDVMNDTIRITFSSKKIKGGIVTKVVRLTESSISLVFFSNYEDAERILEYSEDNDILVSKQPVSVTLYFHNMSDDHVTEERETPQPKPKKGNGGGQQKKKKNETTPKKNKFVIEFRETPDVDCDVILFVNKSKERYDPLMKSLENEAEVEITEKSLNKEKGIVINYKPKFKSLPNDLKQNQKRFETKCKDASSVFLGQFFSKSATFDKDNLSALRKAKLWNEDHDFVKIETAENHFVEVYVRWSLVDPGRVTVTGVDDDVTDVMTYLKKKCDITEESTTFQKTVYRALLECNLIRKFEDEMKDKVTVTSKWMDNDELSGIVSFKGPSSSMHEARSKLNDLAMTLITNPIPDLGGRGDFLLSSLLAGGRGLGEGQVDVRQIVQAKFNDDTIYVSLQEKSGEVCLMYLDSKQRDKAVEALKETVSIRTIEVGEGYDAIVTSPEWKRLRQNIQATGAARIVTDKNKSSIEVVGLCYNFESNFRKLSDHVGENVIIATEVGGRRADIVFLQKHPEMFEDFEAKTKDVALSFETRGSPGIVVKGKPKRLEKAVEYLNQCLAKLTVKVTQLHNPGIPAHFRSPQGREEVEVIASRSRCIGIVAPDLEGAQESGVGRRLEMSSEIKVQVPNSGVWLHLVADDITQVDCDAIVNASNKELELRNGGISGSIISKGGRGIQREMDEARIKNGGQLSPGQAVSTSAGNLPMKRIIHTAGPEWHHDSNCGLTLKTSIISCLNEATKHNLKSFAVPAISCGIFGGKPDVCVPIIVNTVVDFITYNPDSSLKQVVFVEISNKTTMLEFKSALNGIRGNKPQPRPRFPPKKVVIPKVKTTQKPKRVGPEIVLHMGDISTFQSDVIVTTTNATNLASGQGSAISKALYKTLGAQFQSACAAAASSNPSLRPGDVINTPALSLPARAIYHVIMAHYGHGGEKIIREGVQRCLAMADAAGYQSIAFPCLGSGGFKFPADKVAEWVDDVVGTFPAGSLRKVILVILPSDQVSLAAFQTQFKNHNFQQHQGQSAATASSQIDVAVRKGCITSAKCDVIVNSTSKFNLSGQVGKVLTAKGGPSIAQECANSPQFQSPTLRITGAGKLPYKHIFHLNVSNDVNQLENALVELLKEADKRGMRSLAMPPVGTGNIGLQPQDVGKCIQKSIGKFEQSNPQALRKIRVYVFEPTMVATIQQELAKTPNAQNAGFFKSAAAAVSNAYKKFTTGNEKKAPTQAKPPSILPRTHQSTDSVTILFCSLPDNVEKAVEALHAKVADLSTSKTFESETIEELTTTEEKEIMALAQKRNVEIEKNKVNTLTFHGIKVEVLEAYNEIVDLINRYKEALISAEYVTWKYKDSATDQLKDFELFANHELESAYKKNDKGSKSIVALVKGQRRKYLVDFSSMQQTCSNGAVAKVERSINSSSVDVIPTEWEDMGGQPWKKVVLAPNSPEYQHVLALFNQTLQINVVKVERVQNPTLYKIFHAQKTKVANRLAADGSSKPVTREIFHGTVGSTCDSICKDNFDRGHAGINGVAYGSGVYFATSAQYSDGYARGSPKHMFLAEVITGEYTTGKSTMRVPPMQLNDSPYDSVVNSTAAPSMYVVFKDASVYPSYLVTYK